MVWAFTFLQAVGECICAGFPLAIGTRSAYLAATVGLPWSTYQTALPKVRGTNQHENSAHSCSRPGFYTTIMAKTRPALPEIALRKSKCLYTDRKILPQKQRQHSAIATTPASAYSGQASSSCHTLLMPAVPRAHSDDDEIELTTETQTRATHAQTPPFADLYVSKGDSCCCKHGH